MEAPASMSSVLLPINKYATDVPSARRRVHRADRTGRSAEAMPDRASELCHGLAAAVNAKLLQDILYVILGGAGPTAQMMEEFFFVQSPIHQFLNPNFSAHPRNAT